MPKYPILIRKYDGDVVWSDHVSISRQVYANQDESGQMLLKKVNISMTNMISNSHLHCSQRIFSLLNV